MTEQTKPARVRYAPSPTGYLHLGGARTALYNFLLARKTGGQFILRIEDTDRRRFVEDAESEQMDGLRWLGLQWDEGPDVGGPYGPYRQSERKEIYLKYANQLVESGHAFYCFCSPERLNQVRQERQKRKEPLHYDGTCRNIPLEEAKRRIANGEPYVIRFKTPKEGTTTVYDELRGEITIENSMIDDYVLVKSDGLALYHLAAMVDDHLMKITHVFRGSEWLPTFPLHTLLYRAFGWEMPKFVHLSVFLKPSGKGKMSKRDVAELGNDGYSIFVRDFKEYGYLPQALDNWIALMGWSYDDHTEFFTLEDLIEKFSIEKLNPSPAAINFSKLDHFNGLHIRSLSVDELKKWIKPQFEKLGYSVDDGLLTQIIPLIRERMVTFDDAPRFAEFFFKDEVNPDVMELIAKNTTAIESAEIAQKCLSLIKETGTIKAEKIESPMRDLVEQLGYKPGQVFGILRVAVTGQAVSPPLFECMEILGKEKVISRLQNAIRLLKSQIGYSSDMDRQ